MDGLFHVHVIDAIAISVNKRDRVNHLPEEMTRIKIDAEGIIDAANWPDGFFDQTDRDMSALFN